MSVTNITESGATFMADIFSLGTEPIIDHGFTWGNYPDPNVENFDKILLGPCDRTGIYSADIVANLIRDRQYYVKPFILTADHIVYGSAFSFVSLGSGAPTITGFEPHIAGWMDTLLIRGRNFSFRPGTNMVKLNDTGCEVISSTDTTIRAVVSYDLSAPESVLSVDDVGNKYTFTKDTFRLIPPVLTDFYPKQARWGDTIYIRGHYLKYVLYLQKNSINLGTFKCPSIQGLNDTTFIAKVPFELNAAFSDLVVSVNGYDLKGKSQFQLLSPSAFSFSPLQGTWGDIITLTGQFNTIADRNSIFFNDVQASILSFTPNIIKVKVPSNLEKPVTNLIFVSEPFTLSSADTFHLKSPVITSIDPLSSIGNELVTIKGKYFGSQGAIVKFGSVIVDVISQNDSIIVTKVPVTLNGVVKISVEVKMQTVVSNDDLTVTNPVISGILPATATFNDPVTISGQNLQLDGLNTSVTFGNYNATVVSVNSNQIVVQVPSLMDSIPSRIYVQVGQIVVSSDDKFILLPPIIGSITPNAVEAGQEITINGMNFNPQSTLNNLFWSAYQLNPESSTSTQIITIIPVLPRGTARIKLQTGGFTRFGAEDIIVNSKWAGINIPESFNWDSSIPDVYNAEGVYFTLNGKGYMMNYLTGEFVSFDSGTETFTSIGYYPEFKYNAGLTSVINNDTAYIIGYPVGLDRYDPVTKDWINLASFPEYSRNGIGFSLNGHIYFGLTRDGGTFSSKLYQYDKQSGWIVKSVFSDNPYSETAYFSINNIGYVLFENQRFYKYDPDLNTWTRLADFPGKCIYGEVTFVMDSKAYVGLGSDYFINYDNFWTYDPVTDTWEQSMVIPGGARVNSVGFSIANKVYIGFGYHTFNHNSVYHDFYEYDPSYPLK